MKFLYFIIGVSALVGCRLLHRLPADDGVIAIQNQPATADKNEGEFRPSPSLQTLLYEAQGAVQYPVHKLEVNKELCRELQRAVRSIDFAANEWIVKNLTDDWDRPKSKSLQFLQAFGHCQQSIEEAKGLFYVSNPSALSLQDLERLKKAWALTYYSSSELRLELEKSLGDILTYNIIEAYPSAANLTAIAAKTLAKHNITASYTVLRLWWKNETLSKYYNYYLRSMGLLDPKKSTQDFLQHLSAAEFGRRGMSPSHNKDLNFILTHLRRYPPTRVDSRVGVLFLLAMSPGKVSQLAMNALVPLIEKQPEQMAKLYASQPQNVRDHFLTKYGNQGPHISQPFLKSLRLSRF